MKQLNSQIIDDTWLHLEVRISEPVLNDDILY